MRSIRTLILRVNGLLELFNSCTVAACSASCSMFLTFNPIPLSARAMECVSGSYVASTSTNLPSLSFAIRGLRDPSGFTIRPVRLYTPTVTPSMYGIRFLANTLSVRDGDVNCMASRAATMSPARNALTNEGPASLDRANICLLDGLIPNTVRIAFAFLSSNFMRSSNVRLSISSPASNVRKASRSASSAVRSATLLTL